MRQADVRFFSWPETDFPVKNGIKRSFPLCIFIANTFFILFTASVSCLRHLFPLHLLIYYPVPPSLIRRFGSFQLFALSCHLPSLSFFTVFRALLLFRVYFFFICLPLPNFYKRFVSMLFTLILDWKIFFKFLFF